MQGKLNFEYTASLSRNAKFFLVYAAYIGNYWKSRLVPASWFSHSGSFITGRMDQTAG